MRIMTFFVSSGKTGNVKLPRTARPGRNDDVQEWLGAAIDRLEEAHELLAVVRISQSIQTVGPADAAVRDVFEQFELQAQVTHREQVCLRP